MRIVIFNWRDIKNPQSGGAEVLTHEISKVFIRHKHSVIIFTSQFPGGKEKEEIDGVQIIRRGHPDLRSGISSVHYLAYKYYQEKKFGEIDFLIDEVHGVPFFTPFYVKEKKVALICEYAGDLWKYAVPFPLSYIAQAFEHTYPLLYKNTPVITISKSSKKELSKLFPEKNIDIVYPGCDFPVVKNIPIKPDALTLVFIARLSKTKGVEDAIETVNILKRKKVEVKLYIIGRGEEEYLTTLKKSVEKKNLKNNIVFCGFISEKEKEQIIDKTHFLLAPSRKEGWGLTVHEVGARGVPAVGYNVQGLREVIVPGVNGELSNLQTPEDLASKCIEIFKDKRRYKKLQEGAISERKKFTWEKSGEEFLRLLKVYENKK